MYAFPSAKYNWSNVIESYFRISKKQISLHNLRYSTIGRYVGSGPSRPFMLAISYQYKVVKLCILKSITCRRRPPCSSLFVSFEEWSIYHLCTQYLECVICKECSLYFYVFAPSSLYMYFKLDRAENAFRNGCCPRRMRNN